MSRDAGRAAAQSNHQDQYDQNNILRCYGTFLRIGKYPT